MRLRKPRVTIVSTQYPPIWGGAERVAEQLAAELARRGHRVTVLTGWQAGLRRTEESPTGVYIQRLGLGGKAGRLNSLAFSIHLLWIMATRGRTWDVLHNFLISTLTTLCALWGDWTGHPVFVSLGGTGATSDLGQIFRDSWQGRRKFRFIARRVQFIACSAESAEQLKAADVEQSRICELPNPVDLTRFCPPDPRRRRELREQLGFTGPVALFVGRLVHVKGVDRLWAAWPDVRLKYPNAVLVIVGDGAEQARLREKCPPGARMEGARDPVPYYQAADLFLLPSRSEGMSLALLEAMACALPLVATDVSGTKGLVVDGKTGWIVMNTDKRDPLARAVVCGLAPGVREEFGPRSRALVERGYGLDQWMDTLLKMYGVEPE